jgi:hypothetical protein
VQAKTDELSSYVRHYVLSHRTDSSSRKARSMLQYEGGNANHLQQDWVNLSGVAQFMTHGLLPCLGCCVVSCHMSYGVPHQLLLCLAVPCASSAALQVHSCFLARVQHCSPNLCSMTASFEISYSLPAVLIMHAVAVQHG